MTSQWLFTGALYAGLYNGYKEFFPSFISSTFNVDLTFLGKTFKEKEVTTFLNESM